jgi:ribosomal protein S18 acetylase RimI-like enzyme
VLIEPATAADVEVISLMLGEIEAYYGGTNTAGDQAAIRRALFGPRPAATVLLARDGDHVLALASYSLIWPAAGADISLYLKELYVRENARRRGVGRALMSELRTIASAAGISRIEWTADADNPVALEAYKALGFEPRAGKAFYRWEA